MQDEPSREQLEAVSLMPQRAILALLLTDWHSGPWSADELAHALGDEIDAEDALAELHAFGLVHRCERFVWPTGAAVFARRVVRLD